MGGSLVWHPNTQMSEWARFDSVTRARGMYLHGPRGGPLIDGVASMWCNVWGHSRPELVRAMRRQAGLVQHSPLFNLTHGPAERLARALAAQSPGMRAVFYSDDGSTATEAAMKMAIQYWRNRGEPRRSGIASLRGGYHGDTFGAMSAGYSPGFFSAYRARLFRALRLPAPRPPAGPGAAECLAEIERRLPAAAGSTAALIMESGAQMAGGVWPYPPGFQRGVARICRRNGVLLIADEVASGLGRLGHMAEYAHQGGRPDVVAYGKMVTGGYAALGATLASARVYREFLGGHGSGRHLFHGHTFSGNPVAAAVAVENLRLYRRERLLRRVAESSRMMAESAAEIAGAGGVGAVRCAGMAMGIELARRGGGRESANRAVFEEGRRRGVYLRALGGMAMVVPPLAIPRRTLARLLGAAAGAARAAGARA